MPALLSLSRAIRSASSDFALAVAVVSSDGGFAESRLSREIAQSGHGCDTRPCPIC